MGPFKIHFRLLESLIKIRIYIYGFDFSFKLTFNLSKVKIVDADWSFSTKKYEFSFGNDTMIEAIYTWQIYFQYKNSRFQEILIGKNPLNSFKEEKDLRGY